MLKAGQVLKQRYEVLQDLAQGGSSRVYLVCDRVSGKKRALKEVAALADAKMCDIAKREAEFIRKLNYPYFPEIFEVLSVRHADYIVMEYLEGRHWEIGCGVWALSPVRMSPGGGKIYA